MGFGNYDESEQEKQELTTDTDSSGIRTHINDYDGEITFELESSQTDLIDRLAEMKSPDDD